MTLHAIVLLFLSSRGELQSCDAIAMCDPGAPSCEAVIWECSYPLALDRCLSETMAYVADRESRQGDGFEVLGCSTRDAATGPWPYSVDVDASELAP